MFLNLGAEQSDVPMEIKAHLNQMVELGVCEREWVEEVESFQILSLKNQNQSILAAPCALWAYNQTWSLYLLMPKKSRENLVVPLMFQRFDFLKNTVYGSALVENFLWDQDSERLQSRRFLNGHPWCGEVATYQWNQAQGEFETLSLFKNENCGSLNEPWKRVL